MRHLTLGFALVSVLVLSGLALSEAPKALKEPGTLGTIEVKDADALGQILAADAKIEKLAEGFKWSEGPVWLPAEKALLFSDIPRNTIWKYQPSGQLSEFLNPAGYTGDKKRGGEPGTNGLTLDAQGRLVMCEHGDRRITRLVDGKKVTLVDRYEGKRLNSPNDLCFKSNGDLYFTDPIYGLEKGWDDPARELDFCGVYRLSKDGQLTLLTKEMSRPNGIAFSPDEKKLYVANSDPAKPIWMEFTVQDDGTLGKRKVFADATEWVKEKKKGLPDGMKLDKDGNVFATGPGGVHIFSPDGRLLGTLATGVATANVGWGEDGSVLYITADSYLARIKTRTKGAGWK